MQARGNHKKLLIEPPVQFILSLSMFVTKQEQGVKVTSRLCVCHLSYASLLPLSSYYSDLPVAVFWGSRDGGRAIDTGAAKAVAAASVLQSVRPTSDGGRMRRIGGNSLWV